MNYFSNLNPFFKNWFRLKEKLYTDAIKDGILNCTCQFFLDNQKNDKPRPHGSGVFIEYKDTKYLVSAAHVLENHYDKTYVILGVDSLVLGGTLFISKLPTGCKKRDDDYLDIAVLKLDQTTIDKLTTHNVEFVKHERLDINHKASELSLYLTFGFPAAKTDLRFKDTVEAMAMETGVVESEKWYAKYSISSIDNIIAKYNRSGLFTNKNPLIHTGVKPFGISGCGLWSITTMKPEKGKVIPTTLVGILTTWISQDSKMIATHISKVLKFIDDETN